MQIKSVEIVAVGTELLMGDVVNTNTAYIAKELTAYGVNVYHHATVGDNEQRMEQTICEALERADAVIATGGLGPTYDDITKEVSAKIMGQTLVFNEQLWVELNALFDKWGVKITENNRSQAMMPTNSEILPNPNGTACGVVIYNDDRTKCIVLLPGPPREMKPMFDKWAEAYLADENKGKLYSKNLHFFGIGEAPLEEQLKGLMQSSTEPTIAPYAKTGEVMLRMTTRANTAEEAEKVFAPSFAEINRVAGEFLYGINVNTLQQAVVEYLSEHSLTCAVAESCTGGMVGSRITEISGASRVFRGGIICYCNEVKNKLLNVSQEILEEHGAISEHTAVAMAKGLRESVGADISVSVTGNAGPNPAENKPVGRVYIAVESSWSSFVTEINIGRRDEDARELIRYVASSHALNLILKTAKQKINQGDK